MKHQSLKMPPNLRQIDFDPGEHSAQAAIDILSTLPQKQPLSSSAMGSSLKVPVKKISSVGRSQEDDSASQQSSVKFA